MIEQAQAMLSNYFQLPLKIKEAVQLSEPDRRNLILRLNIATSNDKVPHSIILKKTTIELKGETEQEQMSRFARDWAGIEFLSKLARQHAPLFYGGSLENQFILIEDLGEPHYSLVGPLTRACSPENTQQAIDALKLYTHRVGQMHADTFGKTKEFNEILQSIYPKTLRLHALSEKDFTQVLACFKRHTGISSQALQLELEAIQQSMSSDDFKVLLHGDICPDNVYFQQSNMQIIDFEYGDMGHALIDGVYLRMSMPSCWCAKSFPNHIISQMEEIYYDELKAKMTSAVDKAHFNKMLVYACAFWAVRVINWHVDELMEHDKLCPSGPIDSDSLWCPQENVFRPRVISRLEAFIKVAKDNQQLPAFMQAASTLLAFLKNKWPKSQAMDYYPVFAQGVR